MYKGRTHEDHPSPIEMILPSLRQGVPIDEVKQIANQLSMSSDWIESLIAFISEPGTISRTQLRKSAWILNHAFQIDERLFFAQRDQLNHLLDVIEDFSALRELLKMLAHPVWLDYENDKQRIELLELSSAMLHLEGIPVAIYYACMQIMQSRSLTSSECKECIASLQSLRQRSEINSPLYRCIHRYEIRFRQKLTRVNFGN